MSIGYSLTVSNDGASTATVTGTAMIAPIRRAEADGRAGEELLAAHGRLRGAGVGSSRRGFAGRGAVFLLVVGRFRHECVPPVAMLPGSITADPAALRNAEASATNCPSRCGLRYRAAARPRRAARIAEASGVMGRSARRRSESPRATASGAGRAAASAATSGSLRAATPERDARDDVAGDAGVDEPRPPAVRGGDLGEQVAVARAVAAGEVVAVGVGVVGRRPARRARAPRRRRPPARSRGASRPGTGSRAGGRRARAAAPPRARRRRSTGAQRTTVTRAGSPPGAAIGVAEPLDADHAPGAARPAARPRRWRRRRARPRSS